MTSTTMKLCFVTVGATASFHLLLEAVLDESFLEALQKLDYTHLLVQYGKDSRALFEELRGKHRSGKHGIKIEGFDFNTAGLDSEMRMAQANPSDERAGGVIISHAGSGSILGALRLGVPLIVVPNPTLQDNHQEELAQQLQKQGYVVSSSVKEMAAALPRVEKLRANMLTWPPVSGVGKKKRPPLEQVMSDEMGFLD
ncbi:family 28 putative glycosyltransferase [Aspergillus campestris IBT 28561]|uniref:UDP-N-acetylglucosamine transferase subunit ALG13 n=1 Tax=Aspergillus campestris (strain IBT 28561) TaxID=1392248 RepID=A0A2I1DC49_ASPC2|nr:family 28 putative glycosyltransferase [Aspergillus campestris IBT 28561]PKY07428.1 family 28 putative glycosyltransferase [Aspergillus campestris IBT 28561]